MRHFSFGRFSSRRSPSQSRSGDHRSRARHDGQSRLGLSQLTADLENTKYTDVVKDTSVEKGHIYVRKDSKMRIEITEPDPRTILRDGDSLFVYTPKIKRVEEYDLGKNRAMVDQYVLLGFGTRSEALQKGYDVKLTGEEQLDGKKDISAGADAKVRRRKTSDHEDPDVDRFGVVAADSAEIFRDRLGRLHSVSLHQHDEEPEDSRFTLQAGLAERRKPRPPRNR